MIQSSAGNEVHKKIIDYITKDEKERQMEEAVFKFLKEAHIFESAYAKIFSFVDTLSVLSKNAIISSSRYTVYAEKIGVECKAFVKSYNIMGESFIQIGINLTNALNLIYEISRIHRSLIKPKDLEEDEGKGWKEKEGKGKTITGGVADKLFPYINDAEYLKQKMLEDDVLKLQEVFENKDYIEGVETLHNAFALFRKAMNEMKKENINSVLAVHKIKKYIQRLTEKYKESDLGQMINPGYKEIFASIMSLEPTMSMFEEDMKKMANMLTAAMIKLFGAKNRYFDNYDYDPHMSRKRFDMTPYHVLRILLEVRGRLDAKLNESKIRQEYLTARKDIEKARGGIEVWLDPKQTKLAFIDKMLNNELVGEEYILDMEIDSLKQKYQKNKDDIKGLKDLMKQLDIMADKKTVEKIRKMIEERSVKDEDMKVILGHYNDAMREIEKTIEGGASSIGKLKKKGKVYDKIKKKTIKVSRKIGELIGGVDYQTPFELKPIESKIGKLMNDSYNIMDTMMRYFRSKDTELHAGEYILLAATNNHTGAVLIEDGNNTPEGALNRNLFSTSGNASNIKTIGTELWNKLMYTCGIIVDSNVYPKIVDDVSTDAHTGKYDDTYAANNACDDRAHTALTAAAANTQGEASFWAFPPTLLRLAVIAFDGLRKFKDKVSEKRKNMNYSMIMEAVKKLKPTLANDQTLNKTYINAMENIKQTSFHCDLMINKYMTDLYIIFIEIVKRHVLKEKILTEDLKNLWIKLKVVLTDLYAALCHYNMMVMILNLYFKETIGVIDYFDYDIIGNSMLKRMKGIYHSFINKTFETPMIVYITKVKPDLFAHTSANNTGFLNAADNEFAAQRLKAIIKAGNNRFGHLFTNPWKMIAPKLTAVNSPQKISEKLDEGLSASKKYVTDLMGLGASGVSECGNIGLWSFIGDLPVNDDTRIMRSLNVPVASMFNQQDE